MIQSPTRISPCVLHTYSNSFCNKSLLQLNEHFNNYKALICPRAQLKPGLIWAVTLSYHALGSTFTNLQWAFRLVQTPYLKWPWRSAKLLLTTFRTNSDLGNPIQRFNGIPLQRPSISDKIFTMF